jgi:IS5 family transposase
MHCRAVDAALHDSQAVDHLLMQGNTGLGVSADAAYRSEEMEAKLRDRKLKSHIHQKGKRPSRDITSQCTAGQWASR